MLKVFVDSDIILDLLAKREPHYLFSAKLFSLIDLNKIKGYTSPIVFANVHYILSKYSNKKTALKSLRNLRTFLSVLKTDERVIDQALNSDFTDFEDAIQYYTAVNNQIKVILTRNKKDFKKSQLTVATSEEFINTWISK